MTTAKRITSIILKEIAKSAAIKKERVHVIPKGGKWAVKFDGIDKAARVFANKEDAIDNAKILRLKTSSRNVVIHNAKGRVQKTIKK